MIHETCLVNHVGTRGSGTPGNEVFSEQTSRVVFFGISTLLFVCSAALTAAWCRTMGAMGGMPMPGGWTMSMMWMPGQRWIIAGVSFVGMWMVMMVAMMLPSLSPSLWRYYESLGKKPCRGRSTLLVGLGYFFSWTVPGLAIYPIGKAAAALAMKQPGLMGAVPWAGGVVVLLAGTLQFTSWKADQLTRCRQVLDGGSLVPANAGAALGLGFRFGLYCILSCCNLTVILLVVGVMDLRAMIAVTAGITGERLAPSGDRVARAVGSVVVGLAIYLCLSAFRSCLRV